MSQEQISKNELEFIETWHTPQALLELLFHNWDNLNSFDVKRFGELRLYQAPMLSDESIVDFELTAELEHLDKQEIFDCRKRVGDIYCFGARKYGKSLVTMIMDLIVQMLTNPADKVALGSVDLIHLKQVLDPVKNCFESHPICKQWKKRITGAPDFKIELKNDWVLNSVNFNIGSKSPGQNFYGKHVFRLYLEEDSLETQEVYDKRKDALSEMGAVIRASGMTNFTPHSPAGNAFYDPKLKVYVLNLPQYVNPTFNEDKKKKAEEDYGGKSSIGYRVYVDGEIVEDAISVFDMERVRRLCVDELKTIKTIEISKEQFKFFRQFIVCDRPSNSERIFIDSDIGIHTTEINVFSEVDDKYEYLYNITLHMLTDDEQADVFKYLAGMLQANVIGIDCGDGMGRAIYNELEKTISKENLVWYDGKEKVTVGFEVNDKGEILFDQGVPVPKQERMAEWSVKVLKDLFYEGKLIIPEDYKFLSQFGQVISMISGDKILYRCNSPQGDHLFDSFRVFAIAYWLRSNANKTPDINLNWGGGVNGNIG
jgi:hypothetical protein